MLKKTAFAVMSLTVSGFANAAMYAPAPAPTCTPSNVTVPCEANAWDVGVQALYLKPIVDANNSYVVTTNGVLPSYHEFERDWDWGYRLDVSYHFGTGNDVTGYWTHFDDTTNKGFDLGPVFAGGLHNYEQQNKFDQFNLVMGQHIDAGMNKNMRFYGGLQYVQIRGDLDDRYNIGATNYKKHSSRKFSGLGPVIGADFSYDLGNGFSLTANAASALVYGTTKSYVTGFSSMAPGVVVASTRASNNMLVPEVEAKLGASYTKTMAQGVLTVEGGYQVMNYFNGLQTAAANGNVAVPPLPMPSAYTNADYGLQGPYFGVKWLGNA